MLRKTCFSLFAVLVAATSANAATVYLNMVLDPATTAGSGIAPVTDHNGGSAASWVVNSSRSGAGTWHLFALDTSDSSDTGGSPNMGIGSYNITLSNVGSTPTLNQRSPVIQWNDTDGNGPYSAGYSLLRANNQNPFAGSQPLAGSVPAFITGIGQTASNFGAKISAAGVGLDATAWGTQTSGQWGNYADAAAAPTGGLNWVFLAEGTYTAGSPPAVTVGGVSTVNVLTTTNGAVKTATVVLGTPGAGGTAPNITDALIDNVNGATPGNASVQMTATGTTPITWDSLQFVSMTPGFGNTTHNFTPTAGSYTLTSGGLFNWAKQGSFRGTYVFSLAAHNSAGSDTGQVTVNVTQIPEPASLSLLGLALVGVVTYVRRRS